MHAQTHLGAGGGPEYPPPRQEMLLTPFLELRSRGHRTDPAPPGSIQQWLFLWASVSWRLNSMDPVSIKLFQPLASVILFSAPCAPSYLQAALTSGALPSLHSHFHYTSEALLFSILQPLNWSCKIQPFLSNTLYNFQKQSFKHVNPPDFQHSPQIPDPRSNPGSQACGRKLSTCLLLSVSRILLCT